MYNRYYGNSGRVERVVERPRELPHSGLPMAAPPHAVSREQARNVQPPGLLDRLSRMLPGTREPLETEDLILLLILYLMYRESGDKELLMILGGFFLF